MVPGVDECYALLKKYGVPPHIVQHSRVVHDVALCLCLMLNRHGEKLDQARVEAGSLLHDIAKMEGLHTGESHPRAGALLLSRLGYPEVADIVRQHVVLDDGTPQSHITEPTVVHYADKRVRHVTVVSLAERFRDLKERYGKTSSALAWLEDLEGKSILLEERIFQRLPIQPDSLNSLAEGGVNFSGEFEDP
jgi:putative nucleotidyltransferase with HDIG domain